MCTTEYKGEEFVIKFHYGFTEKKVPYKLIMRRQLSEDKKKSYKSFPVIIGGTVKLLKTACEIVKVGENGETELISVGETIQSPKDNLNYAYARIQSFWYALTDIKDLHLALKLLYSYFHDFNKTRAAKKNLDAVELMYTLLDEFDKIKKLDDEILERTEA
jgi:hypothetical protein